MPDLLSSEERTLSRRERERLRRRRTILRAAQAVFAEKGYAQATLDEIAKRAEFGKGTLYNYFEGGKEDLLFAIFDRIFDHLHDLLQEAFATDASSADVPPLRDRYHDFAVAYISFFREQEDLFMVLIKEVHRSFFSNDTERAAYFKRQHERLTEALIPLLEQARQSSEIRELPAQAVAHMLMGNTQRMQLVCAMERSASFLSEETPAAGGDACAEKETPMDDPHRAADFLTTILFDGLTMPAAAR